MSCTRNLSQHHPVDEDATRKSSARIRDEGQTETQPRAHLSRRDRRGRADAAYATRIDGQQQAIPRQQSSVSKTTTHHKNGLPRPMRGRNMHQKQHCEKMIESSKQSYCSYYLKPKDRPQTGPELLPDLESGRDKNVGITHHVTRIVLAVTRSGFRQLTITRELQIVTTLDRSKGIEECVTNASSDHITDIKPNHRMH